MCQRWVVGWLGPGTVQHRPVVPAWRYSRYSRPGQEIHQHGKFWTLWTLAAAAILLRPVWTVVSLVNVDTQPRADISDTISTMKLLLLISLCLSCWWDPWLVNKLIPWLTSCFWSTAAAPRAAMQSDYLLLPDWTREYPTPAQLWQETLVSFHSPTKVTRGLAGGWAKIINDDVSGVEYYKCTYADSPIAWCATQVLSVIYY